MNILQSQPPIQLNNCSREDIINYFQNAWTLEDILMKSIIEEVTFYHNPDALRNPLIFYLGHSAVFYINKLIRVNLLEKRINPDYEILFEVGVDPQTPEELKAAISHIQWPQIAAVWEYRYQAYQVILETIKNAPLNFPILPNHPLWALMMGIEHQRIHFETSSMLIRQIPVEKVARPENWEYAPTYGKINNNPMLEISGGTITIGKQAEFPLYGWDNEYGDQQIEVKPFTASKYMITNAEFREFVNADGYENPDLWDQEAWEWKKQNNIKHPKFWVVDEEGNYKYRAMFDQIDFPLDWPVEVNHYEASAYCRWKGEKIRLMSEAEWNLATYQSNDNKNKIEKINNFNLNLKFGSPSPVGMLNTDKNSSGLEDLRGNVWEWLSETFHPLPGFNPHFLYEDNSTPFFDQKHKMMLGGAWVTTGTQALQFYRNWFRPYFYQHAGFRIVEDK